MGVVAKVKKALKGKKGRKPTEPEARLALEKEKQKAAKEAAAKIDPKERKFPIQRPDRAFVDLMTVIAARPKVKLEVVNETLKEMIMSDGKTTKALNRNAIKTMILQNDYLVEACVEAIQELYKEASV